MKKELALIFSIIFLMSIVYAQEVKIGISTIKEIFQPGENIALKLSLLDSGNNPISDSVKLIFENAEKTQQIEKTVLSNKLEEINLGESASSGYWTITANYQKAVSKAIFSIETNELAKFELNDNTLVITNIGNTRYSKSVQILIGDIVGVKNVDLTVGEKISFRLIAPQGTYNIKVTDGKTSLSKNSVSLTGEAIGILDEKLKSPAPITGARVEGSPEGKVFNLIKNNGLAYVFVLVIVGAIILLTIERQYRKKMKDN